MSATARTPGRGLRIDDVFRDNARVVPDRLAATLGDARLSHGALDALANRTAHALVAAGVRRGDRIVVWADTHLGQVPLFAAAAKLGAVFAPVNARLGPVEAAAVARLVAPRLAVVDAERGAHLGAFARETGAAPAHLGGVDAPGLDLSEPALPPEAGDAREPALSEDDPHVVFFTSGSTGQPKGVVLSHRVSWLRSFQGVFHDEPRRTVCMFPMFHMAPWTLALAAWQTRGSIHFVSSPTPELLLAEIAARRANHFYGIPLVWSRLLEAGLDGHDLTSLRELDTGTSAVPPELLRALRARFPHCTLRVYYGSTEAGTVAALASAEVLERPGSVGFAPPGGELRIATDGEVLARSPYLFDGYYDDPAATRAALVDGWFHTGDLGALDADGALSIVGRKKDVIRSGGESIAPAEVEAALQGAPGVRELAVVGIPDPEWGEQVCVVVVPEAGGAPTLASLRAHCGDRLAGYKHPRRLELAKGLPRTAATGQVQRALLTERILAGVPL